MKTTFIFLTFTLLGFISQQALIAGPADLAVNDIIEFTACSEQPDPAVSELKDLLTDLGFEIDVLEFEDGVDEKKCTMTVKGVAAGQIIDLEITIDGVSCSEFIANLIKELK